MNKHTNYYLLVFKEDWADEFNVPALECMKEEDYLRWKKKNPENTYAYLGNFGQDFEEKFEGYKTMEELVGNKVKVYQVPIEFYTIFHHAKLDELSLCNIFDLPNIE